jgi:bacillithiol synthase
MALAFDIRPLAYEALAPYAEVAILARLAAGTDPARFPRFTREAAASDGGAERCIVAGQQPALLTGPLYTFLKAVSAIALAREVSSAGGAPVRPLFWIASEDHDVLEVNRVTVNGRRFVHPYAGEIARGRVPPVADIPLADAREPLLAFLREALPPTEFTPWVMDLVAGLDYASYATAFASLMRALFAPWALALVEPAELRARTAPVLAGMVERWPELERALDEGAHALRAAGIDPPLEEPGLFEIVAGKRVPVAIADGRAALSTAAVSLADAADEIRRRPNDFSAGVALRPLCQDAALPVVATLGGPTELAYLWQIQPLYRVMQIRPSRLHPRISATFLEPGVVRAARQAGFAPERILEALAEDESPAAESSVASAIESRARELLAEIDRLGRADPPRWLRTGREGIEGGVRRIAEGLAEERRAATGLDRARREKIRSAILPGGKLQERGANPIEFLNRHGPEFVARAVETLDPLARHHQIVVIEEQA